jgi:peptidoglycan/LPS O-acetylase OafA/YrhL
LKVSTPVTATTAGDFIPTAHVVSKANRIFELDALRALAAINLMLFHFTWVYAEKYGFTTDIAFKYPYGKYGTQLFFMLSGLVNAMTLLRRPSASEYLRSRSIRILPPFLLVLVLNLFLVQWLPLRDHVQLSTATVAANATLVPGLLGHEWIEPVTWTLQVEVQFYAALLLLFVSGALRRPFWPLIGCLLFCGLYGSWSNQADEAVLGSQLYAWSRWWREALIIDYFPLFAMGIFIHQGYLERRLAEKIRYGVGVLVAAVVFHGIDLRHSSPIATLALVGLLVAAQYGKLPVLRIKPLLFISGISYSLYLLHNNLGTVIIYYLNHSGVPPLACFAITMVLVIAISALVAYGIERPLGRMIYRLLTPHRPAAATQSEAARPTAGREPGPDALRPATPVTIESCS